MKKLFIAAVLILIAASGLKAQKYGFVDMEYILKKIPAYEMANSQLDQLSKKWQTEVEAKFTDTKTLYSKFQSELAFLSPEMKTKREQEVIDKEKEAMELKKYYFGPEGELFKKRESLMKPIQEEVYNAVKGISEEKGYMMIIDRSSSQNMIFVSPKIDISDEVLSKLGYSK